MLTKMFYKLMTGNAYMTDIHTVCTAKLLSMFTLFALLILAAIGTYFLIKFCINLNAKYNNI